MEITTEMLTKVMGGANVTARSARLFLQYAMAASDWDGMPLVGGSFESKSESEDRGNLTQLKAADLVYTERDGRHLWLLFTDRGRYLAAECGINIQ